MKLLGNDMDPGGVEHEGSHQAPSPAVAGADVDSIKFVRTTIIVALLLVVAVLGFYALHFMSSPISDDPADWGVFGDFVGGLANPFLSFVAIVILVLTLKLQAHQLGISSRELELTRQELQRSAAAQERSEKAFREQARAAEVTAKMGAINHLLEHLERKIEAYSQRDNHSHESLGQLKALRIERDGLVEKLRSIYAELVAAEEFREANDSGSTNTERRGGDAAP